MDNETGDKGFRVVDRRSMSEEAREAERKAPGPAPGPEEATPPTPAEGSGPGDAPPPDSGPGGLGAGLHPPGFLDLVQSMQFGAMLNLGMVQGQDGRRSPVDLPAAKDAIDMLGVLKEKTKGNLTAEEDGVLTEGLYVLRMGYLAALNAGTKNGGGKS